MKHLIEASGDMEKNMCNIVLSHFAPEKYSTIDPTSDSTSKNIREFADAFQLKGWFYGHAHDNESIDDRKIGENKVLVP